MYVHLYGEYLFTIALGRRGPLHSSSIQTGILIGERGKILILGHYIRNIPHSSSHTADHYTRNMRYKASHILGHYQIYVRYTTSHILGYYVTNKWCTTDHILGQYISLRYAASHILVVISGIYGTQLVTFLVILVHNHAKCICNPEEEK